MMQFAAGDGKRAAVLLWVSAGWQMLLFGCCSFMLVVIAVIPRGELERLLGQSMPAEQSQQFASEQAAMGFMALVFLLLGFVPAAACLVLGFFVQRGSRPGTVAALVLTIVQAGVVGVILGINLLAAGLTGNVVGLASNLVILGGTLALLIVTAVAVGRVLRGGGADAELETDPWGPPDRMSY